MGVKIDGPRRPAEDVLYAVIRHVRPLHRHLARAVEDQLEGTGITVGMRAVLERLHDDGAQAVPRIARALMLPRQVVQRLVNAALEIELVRAAPNPAHRRSALIELTPAGRRAIDRILAREAAVLRDVAARMARADVDACLRVIAQLTEEFGRISGGRPPGEGGDA
ncbi:MAG TPA: MarR family winged helix-turn-helix transcriptional regulator [Anaeromyxobacter sp.]|jgi:DNA-binding MarR family transcriptional regulator|nr:MarR family winged helix-turn-helix transcriptional regulator [Anaeromyxobacter sp.]